MGVQFSIVVPVGPGRDAPVLASIERLAFPADRLEVLVERGPNPSANRNRAVARARGDILAFADDDCLVPPDWLTQADAFFRQHPTWDVVGGPQLTPPSDTPLAQEMGWALASPFGTLWVSQRYRRMPPSLAAGQLALSSANLFMRRAILDRVGTFDERLWPNEETELLARIAARGGRIAYDPSIVVYHQRRNTLRRFAAQVHLYGRGRARQTWITRRAPAANSIAPLGFLAALAASPALIATSPLFAVPLMAYGTTALGVSTVMALRERTPTALVRLPLIFAVIHVAYATGLALELARLASGRTSLTEGT